MSDRLRPSLVVPLLAFGWLALAVPAGATCSGSGPNGVVDPGEGCDDGNLVEGDGCCNDCTDISCAPAGGQCGDVIVQSRSPEPWEQCDDGNSTPGDGCEPLCETTALLPANAVTSATTVLFDGFVNQVIGGATLALESGPTGHQQLRVSNMGGGLNDGARQIVDSCEMQTTLATPNFSQSIQGSTLVVKQIGMVDHVSGQLFSTVTFQNNGTDIDILNDISPVQPASYRVILYRGRDIVANIGGLANGNLKVPSGSDVNNPDCGVDPKSGQVTVTGDKPTTTSTTSTSTTVTTMTIGSTTTSTSVTSTTFPILNGGPGITVVGGGGITLSADRWLVKAENPVHQVQHQEIIEMLGADVGDVVITHERTNPAPAPFDCNGNGIADPDDIAAATSADVNTNGIPDECEGLIDPQSLSKGQRKCSDAVASTEAAVLQKRAACIASCQKRAVSGATQPSECEPPYTGKTAACVAKTRSGAIGKVQKRCIPDLCSVLRGNSCSGYLDAMVTFAERQADGLGGKLLCPTGTPSKTEEKCLQGLLKETTSFNIKRTNCLRKCRKGELAGKVVRGGCRPPNVTDAATAACIAKAEGKSTARLTQLTCDPPSTCRPFDGTGALSLGAAFGDDVDPRVWGP